MSASFCETAEELVDKSIPPKAGLLHRQKNSLCGYSGIDTPLCASILTGRLPAPALEGALEGFG